MKKRPRDLAKLMIDIASGELKARANCPDNDHVGDSRSSLVSKSLCFTISY